MTNNKNIIIISDSTGETASSVTDAIKVHFDIEDLNVVKFHNILSKEEIDKIFRDLKGDNLIYSTIVDRELLKYLQSKCNENNFLFVDLFEAPLTAAEKFFNQEAKRKVALSHQMGEDYFNKISAVEFAMKYDDGKDIRGIELSDIVLIGISRTSKTPLSLNLAFKNYKVCNIPLVPEIEPPMELFKVNPKKIFGLIIDKKKLNEIRQKRLESLGINFFAEYSSNDRIDEELNYALELYRKIGCKVIDVTNKTIEETSVEIVSNFESLNTGEINWKDEKLF